LATRGFTGFVASALFFFGVKALRFGDLGLANRGGKLLWTLNARLAKDLKGSIAAVQKTLLQVHGDDDSDSVKARFSPADKLPAKPFYVFGNFGELVPFVIESCTDPPFPWFPKCQRQRWSNGKNGFWRFFFHSDESGTLNQPWRPLKGPITMAFIGVDQNWMLSTRDARNDVYRWGKPDDAISGHEKGGATTQHES